MNTTLSNRAIEGVWELVVKHAGDAGSGIVGAGFWEDVCNTSLDYSEVAQALALIRASKRIDIFTQGEGERPMIAVRPERVRCPDCRQLRPGSEDWDEHVADCLRERERLRKLGLLYRWSLAEPKGGRHV